MRPYRQVGVLLVNWNSAEDVIRTVGAVRDEYPELTVIVVDNGSGPEDCSRLERLPFERFIVERLPENRGYAAGVNRGLELAEKRGLQWVWLMNPDAMPYPGCLDALLAASDNCGLLSPRQLSSAEPLAETAVQYVSAAHSIGSRFQHEACSGCSSGYHDVDVVTGTGLLLRVSDAHAVGLLNEGFFHYKEEFEFAERVAAISKVRFVCSARLWHERGGSLSQESPDADYYRIRNELLYLEMRLKRPWRARLRTWRWVLRSAAEAVSARPESRRAIMRGVAHGLLGRSGRAA